MGAAADQALVQCAGAVVVAQSAARVDPGVHGAVGVIAVDVIGVAVPVLVAGQVNLL